MIESLYTIYTPAHTQTTHTHTLKCTQLYKLDPKVTSQVTISQVATSVMCNSPKGSFQKVRLGLLVGRALQLEQARGPNAVARTDLRKLPFGRLNIWEVGTWENTLWEVASWENTPGKYLTSTKIHTYNETYRLVE